MCLISLSGIKLILSILPKKEIESLKAKVLKLPTMSMDIFEKTLETIDEQYPFTLSPKLILALLVVTGICFIILEYFSYDIKEKLLLLHLP